LINFETSQHETDPYLKIKFKKFDQWDINQSIKASRSSEADRTIKATNVPPELDKQTLQEIFIKYGTIERLAIVKKDPYNIVYVVYNNGISTTAFNDV
jgi:RNA recognition motif-containing protein